MNKAKQTKRNKQSEMNKVKKIQVKKTKKAQSDSSTFVGLPVREIKKKADMLSSYGLRFWLSLTVLCVCLATLGYISSKIIDIQKSIKEKDVWTITYLELENTAKSMNSDLIKASRSREKRATYSLKAKTPESSLEFERVSGIGPKTVSAAELTGVNNLAKLEQIGRKKHLVNLGGQNYRVRYNNKILSLTKIENSQWIKPFSEKSNDQITLYMINRAGQTIASNDERIVNPSERALVQKFILSPLSQGQLKFQEGESKIIGFYREMPNSNLILFGEISESLLIDEVWASVKVGTLYAVFAILAALMLVQWPLAKLLSPLARLRELTKKIGNGEYDYIYAPSGVGEIKELSAAFMDLGNKLKSREESISKMYDEQKEAIRLKHELDITSNIQKNFLPPVFEHKKQAGMDVAAKYIPCDEAAGDWYSYHFDEKRNETVIIVADVSGHGVGAAMFTAVIASCYERYKTHDEETFPAEKMLKECNRIIFNLGKCQWHATMLVMIYDQQTKTLRNYSAGHQRPLVYSRDPKGGFKLKPIIVSGPVLGLSDDMEIEPKSHKLQYGDLILGYTDGLVECESPSGKRVTRKKIKQFFDEAHTNESSKDYIATIEENWWSFIDGNPPNDDTCFVVLKVAA